MACDQFIRHSTVTEFATVTPFTQELSPRTNQGGWGRSWGLALHGGGGHVC